MDRQNIATERKKLIFNNNKGESAHSGPVSLREADFISGACSVVWEVTWMNLLLREQRSGADWVGELRPKRVGLLWGRGFFKLCPVWLRREVL